MRRWVPRFFLMTVWLIPLKIQASFIESTMGTAVVNDATATYHNPAALALFNNPQLIVLNSVANFSSQFSGHSLTNKGGVVQSGHANAQAHYVLPSIYLSTPIQEKFRFGLAVVSNMLNSGTDETSILRYTKPNTKIQNIDVLPALGIALNDDLSVGIGLNYSYARFTSNPITGFPALNIPDSQSHNVARDSGYGGNAGFVMKATASTLIGFNYRSAVSYQFSGSSQFKGVPAITSNHYNFDYWTPARSVLTLSHFMTPDIGIISTVQRVQWSVFKRVMVHGVATQVDSRSVILPEVIVPYHFHDTWTYTLGGIKKITPQWVVRAAGTYDQSPSHGNTQITNGDSIVIGASIGYTLYKNWILDGSYAHAFINKKNIDISSKNSTIIGVNQGAGDSLSIKLTVNL